MAEGMESVDERDQVVETPSLRSERISGLSEALRQLREARHKEIPESPGGQTSDLRTSIWERYPADYDVPAEAQEKAARIPAEAFHDPHDWVQEINPGGPRGPLGEAENPKRERNCVDCTRAVERSWRGQPQISAGCVPPNGEYSYRTEDWIQEKFQPTPMSDIAEQLKAGGHGSSAMIIIDYHGGGRHAFNAVNYNGTILAVDGQIGVADPWPPTEAAFGYDETDVRQWNAILRDAAGRRIE